MSPLDTICVDDSRWYGQGGHWINLGFLMYVAMSMNLENGEEIWSSACVWLGIIMRLVCFKSTSHEVDQEGYEENIAHSTKLLKELVLPWENTDRENTDSIILADSYFASVPAAE